MIYAYCLSVFSIHFFAKHSISVPCDPRRDSNYGSSTSRPQIALILSYSTLTTSPLTHSLSPSNSKEERGCSWRWNWFPCRMGQQRCWLEKEWSISISQASIIASEYQSTIRREEWRKWPSAVSISSFLGSRWRRTCRASWTNRGAGSMIGGKEQRMQYTRRCLILFSLKKKAIWALPERWNSHKRLASESRLKMIQRKWVSRRSRIFQAGERFRILRKRRNKQRTGRQKHTNKVQLPRKASKSLSSLRITFIYNQNRIINWSRPAKSTKAQYRKSSSKPRSHRKAKLRRQHAPINSSAKSLPSSPCRKTTSITRWKRLWCRLRW